MISNKRIDGCEMRSDLGCIVQPGWCLGKYAVTSGLCSGVKSDMIWLNWGWFGTPILSIPVWTSIPILSNHGSWMKNMSVLCPHELRSECVMAFDLLTFCDRNRMLKLDSGAEDDCGDDACVGGAYRSDSSISGEKRSSSSNNLSNVLL